MAMGKVQVGLRLDEGLLAAVEVARGDVPRNRWLERLIESELLSEPPGGSGPPDLVPAPPRASVPEPEPVPEAPLPRVARRRWA